MQHSLAQAELGRHVAEERVRRARVQTRVKPEGVAQAGAARQRAARVLARLAWRLDREAALKAWP